MLAQGKVFLIAALIFASSAAKADPEFDRCEEQPTTHNVDIELAPCGAAWVARAEARLKLAWKKALAEVDGSQTDQGKALLTEQRAWIAFKEVACNRYDLLPAGTLGRFHDSYVCRAQVIEDRINELGGLRGKGLG